MRVACALAFMMLAATAGAQDSSYSDLRLRGSLFRNPVTGRIGDDWRAGTGGQLEVATNVGRGELGLAAGHIAYSPRGGLPHFTGTLFSLGFTAPVAQLGPAEVSAGVRLTDFRMDFDDEQIVKGLRTEEEVMLGVLARARMPVSRRVRIFVEGSYGLLMLQTRTPMVLIHAGGDYSMAMPGWIRGLLR